MTIRYVSAHAMLGARVAHKMMDRPTFDMRRNCTMSLVALVVNPTRANTPPRRAASLRQPGFCVSMRHPLVPSHELKPEPVVVDTQVSVAAARDRFRHDFRNFLRHHADIGGVVVPLVAEAVDADAVVEPSERDNVLLQADIGATAVPAGAVRGNAGWPVRGPGM